jgi:hypothetical protein
MRCPWLVLVSLSLPMVVRVLVLVVVPLWPEGWPNGNPTDPNQHDEG